MTDTQERWRCRQCAFVHDHADTATMHAANTDHDVMYGTAELRDLLNNAMKRYNELRGMPNG